jgi:hypothetical protein
MNTVMRPMTLVLRFPYVADPRLITGLDALFLLIVIAALSLYMRYRRRASERKYNHLSSPAPEERKDSMLRRPKANHTRQAERQQGRDE